jgi:hypothetical protein
MGVMVVFSLLVVRADYARAEVVQTRGQQLHVRAQILPKVTVIVNQAGSIIKIMSNTTDDVSPSFYLGSDQQGQEIASTPELSEGYRTLVPLGQNRIGVLYSYDDRLTTRLQGSYLTFIQLAADTQPSNMIVRK